MKKIGRIKYVTRGVYDPDAAYREMDVVLFGGSLWEAKKETTGNAPPDHQKNEDGTIAENEFWKLFLPGALGDDYVKKTDLAKSPTETEPGKPGIIYPDGKTITIDGTGMIKGAPPGKELGQEEMNQQIASGELVDGDVVYLTGPAAGENGLLVKVDSELKDSVNPVQNRAIKAALDRLDALVQETNALRATLETFGLSKVTESSAVTDVNSGLVLSAKEKNASIEGTLANEIKSFDYIKDRVKNVGISWDGTIERAQTLFYTNSNVNWCGIGCGSDGALNIRVGVTSPYVWTFTADGRLLKNGVSVF